MPMTCLIYLINAFSFFFFSVDCATNVRNALTFSGYSSIILSATSLSPRYTISKSSRQGRSSLSDSGGFFMKIFCISINTSNARIKSGCSVGRAFWIREIHLRITFKCYFSETVKSTPKSSGMMERRISNRVTRDVVNSFEFRSLLTIFCTSTVISFCSPIACEDFTWAEVPLMPLSSSFAFSCAKIFRLKSKRAL